MVERVAELTLEVDSRGVRAGRNELSNFTRLAQATERATDRLSRSTSEATRAADRFGNELSQADRAAGRFVDASGRMQQANGRFTQGLNQGRNALGGFGSSLGTVTAAATALVGALGTREIIRYADAWTSAQNQLRQVTDSTQELTQASANLLAVSNDTRTSFESTANLYSRLSRATQELGLSEERLLNITTTINQSFATNGATAQEASAAITQLSQALASGVLRGDEFNSVSEAAPGILRAIADATGQSAGSLRELAAQGAITAGVVVESLEQARQAIADDFGQSVATFGQNLAVANNNITEFVGNSAGIQALVRELGEGIVSLSENLNTIIPILGVATGGIAGWGAAAVISATAARAFAAATAISSAALAVFRTASNGATAAITALSAAVSSSPLGLLARTLGFAAAAFGGYSLANEIAARANDDFAAATARANARIEAQSIATEEAARRKVADIELAIAAVRFEIAATEASIARERAIISQSLAVDRLQGAQAQHTSRINENTAALAANQALLARLEGTADAFRTRYQQILATFGESAEKIDLSAGATDKLSAAQREANRFITNSLTPWQEYSNTVDALNGHLKAGRLTQQEYNQALDQAVEDYSEAQRASESRSISLQRELQQLELTNRELFIQRQLSSASRQDLAQNRAEIEATAGALFDRREELERTRTATEELAREAERLEEEWQQSITDISNELTRGLVGGFESTRDAIRNIFTQMLTDLIAEADVRPIVLQIAGAAGLGPGGRSAAGGSGSGVGLGDLIGAGSSIFSTTGNAASSLFNSFATSSVGQFIGLSTPGASSLGISIADAVATGVPANATLTGFGSAVSTGLNYSPYGIIGNVLGSALGVQGSGNAILDTAFSTAGSIGGGYLGSQLGFAAGGPIGAALGAIAGTALAGLFGGEPSDMTQATVLRGTELDTSFGLTDDRFSQENRDAANAVASSSLALRQYLTGLTGADAPNERNLAFTVGSRDGLFLQESGIAGTGPRQRFETLGDLARAGQESVARQFGLDLELFRGLQQEGEQFGDTIIRVEETFRTATQIAERLSLTFDAAGNSGRQFAANLSEAFGGVEQLNTAFSAYYQNFFTEEERREMVLSDAQSTLDDFNATLGLTGEAAIDTRAEFRGYIESLDLTTQAGADAAASALMLQGALVTVANAADAAAAAVDQPATPTTEPDPEPTSTLDPRLGRARTAAQRAAATQLNRELSASQQLVTNARNAFNTVTTAISRDLSNLARDFQASRGNITSRIGDLTSLGRALDSALSSFINANPLTAAASRAAGRDVLSRAAQGEAFSTQDLERAVRDAGVPNEDLFGSFTDYQREFFATSIDIAAVGRNTGAQLSTAEQSLRSLEDQYDLDVEALEQQRQDAQDQLEALEGIDSSTVSVAEAIARLQASITTAREGARPEGLSSAQIREAAIAIDRQFITDGVVDRDAADRAIGQIAIESGVSSARLAQALGVTQQFVLERATQLGVPAFANGGSHRGGLRLVGERGPELEVTGPSRIIDAGRTRNILQGAGGMGSGIGEKLDEIADILQRNLEVLPTWDAGGAIFTMQEAAS